MIVAVSPGVCHRLSLAQRMWPTQPIDAHFVLLTLNFFAAREVFSYAALASLAVSAALAVSRALITIRPLGLST